MNLSPWAHGKQAALVLCALVFALALAACNTATPTPTSTPTPSPTPTPVPDPIVKLGANATYGDVVALLPDSTVSCLKSDLGDQYQALLGRKIFDSSIKLSASNLPLDCFDHDTIVSLMIAALSQAANGLSNQTVTCLQQSFKDMDFSSLKQLATGDMSSASDALGVGMGMLLCLTDDEASRINAQDLLGPNSDVNLSLKDIRCVIQSVDIRQLTDLVGGLSSTPTATPDMTEMLQLANAFSKCGIDLNSLMNGAGNTTSGSTTSNDSSPGVTPTSSFDLSSIDLSQLDQLPPDIQASAQCLINAVGGEQNAQAFLNGTYTPTVDQLMAASQCNLNFTGQ